MTIISEKPETFIYNAVICSTRATPNRVKYRIGVYKINDKSLKIDYADKNLANSSAFIHISLPLNIAEEKGLDLGCEQTHQIHLMFTGGPLEDTGFETSQGQGIFKVSRFRIITVDKVYRNKKNKKVVLLEETSTKDFNTSLETENTKIISDEFEQIDLDSFTKQNEIEPAVVI
jgi:hypothetical protein